jgi:hypothetical protein
MKTYRSRSGPSSDRPYYSESDFERICTDALRETGLYPSEPQPVRIERFIAKRFGVTPVYEELPESVMGFTLFGSRGVEAVFISAPLAEEGTKVSERRVNTTLAHEAGHGLLHTHLFALPQSLSLFEQDPDVTPTKILCRNEEKPTASPRRGYDGKWWEHQANKAIGPLLLPKELVKQCLQPFIVSRGLLGLGVLDSTRRGEAIRLVSETFDVNPVVARIRLEALYPEAAEGQLTL